MRLAIPSWFRGMPLKLKKKENKKNKNKKTNISTEHDRLNIPSGGGKTSLGWQFTSITERLN